METYAFDLARIFFGDQPPVFLLEVLFRTAILFSYLMLNMRFIGQRSVGQLTSYEIALIIALGSAAGDGLFYDDVPLTHCMAAITAVVVLSRAVSGLSARSERHHEIIEGQTRRIVVDGHFDIDGLKHSTFSRHELLMELRQWGILHLGMVKRAYLEPDGMISVYRYPIDQFRPGLYIAPDGDLSAETMTVPSENWVCRWCGFDKPTPSAAPEKCPNCNRNEWTKAVTAGEVEVKDI